MWKKHWPDWINLILGIWLIITPFLFGFSGQTMALRNAVISGIVTSVIALGAVSAFMVWEEWLNFIVGLWLIVSPWVLGFSMVTAAVWNLVIVGLLVVFFSLWESRIMGESYARAH